MSSSYVAKSPFLLSTNQAGRAATSTTTQAGWNASGATHRGIMVSWIWSSVCICTSLLCWFPTLLGGFSFQVRGTKSRMEKEMMMPLISWGRSSSTIKSPFCAALLYLVLRKSLFRKGDNYPLSHHFVFVIREWLLVLCEIDCGFRISDGISLFRYGMLITHILFIYIYICVCIYMYICI